MNNLFRDWILTGILFMLVVFLDYLKNTLDYEPSTFVHVAVVGWLVMGLYFMVLSIRIYIN